MFFFNLWPRPGAQPDRRGSCGFCYAGFFVVSARACPCVSPGEEMTAAGLEPTPLRNGTLSHRRGPLGQTVLGEIGGQPRSQPCCNSLGARRGRAKKNTGGRKRMGRREKLFKRETRVGGREKSQTVLIARSSPGCLLFLFFGLPFSVCAVAPARSGPNAVPEPARTVSAWGQASPRAGKLRTQRSPQIFRHRDSSPGRSGESRVS